MRRVQIVTANMFSRQVQYCHSERVFVSSAIQQLRSARARWSSDECVVLKIHFPVSNMFVQARNKKCLQQTLLSVKRRSQEGRRWVYVRRCSLLHLIYIWLWKLSRYQETKNSTTKYGNEVPTTSDGYYKIGQSRKRGRKKRVGFTDRIEQGQLK